MSICGIYDVLNALFILFCFVYFSCGDTGHRVCGVGTHVSDRPGYGGVQHVHLNRAHFFEGHQNFV